MDGVKVSMTTASRALKHRLPSGPYMRKKLRRSPLNALHKQTFYAQLFINYLAAKDPRRIKFCDEAGVKLPDIGTRLYRQFCGNSLCGSCEKGRVAKYMCTTLDILVSLDGWEYYNLMNGTTNTLQFLQFWRSWELRELANGVSLFTGWEHHAICPRIIMKVGKF